MDNELKYWIFISICFSYGSNKPYEIYSRFPNAEKFCKMSADEMLSLGFLNEKDIRSLKNTSMLRVDKIIRDCEAIGAKVVSIASEEYPERLRRIYAPPTVLYYKGNIDSIDEYVAIGVVGTRRATEYTDAVTEWISTDLAKAGAIVVSGCAVGIDAAALRGALKGKGRTIGVLTCALDTNYPKENAGLKEDILENGGLLLTEIPPKTDMPAHYIPIRNRIMAGLSLGVLVTHAPVKSGALITAEHALEQGKEVYCLPPYNVMDFNSMGVMKYIRDGSTVIACAEDILIDFYYGYADKLERNEIVGDYVEQRNLEGKIETIKKSYKKQNIDADKPENQKDFILAKNENQNQKRIEYEKKNEDLITQLDEDQLAIYKALDVSPKFVDEISVVTSSNVGAVLATLTELEIMGLAVSCGGKRYALNS